MPILTLPFKYYSVLPDYTLTTKIREKSWGLSKIFPNLRAAKGRLKELIRVIRKNPYKILEVKHTISELARLLRTGMHDLKLINFYDSAIFYIYYRLLGHVLQLCDNELSRIEQERSIAMSQSKAENLKEADIRRAKKRLKAKIKEHEGTAKSVLWAKRKVAEAYEHLAEELEELKWEAEKRAQHEFSLKEITFRSLENLNRKIKVEAIKIKGIAPKKNALLRRIGKELNPKDVYALAKLVSEAVDRMSKDMLYSSKLIAQFEEEINELEEIIAKIKEEVLKLFKERGKDYTEKMKEKVFKQWDEVIIYLKQGVDKDLMEVYLDIFRLQKHVYTREPKGA